MRVMQATTQLGLFFYIADSGHAWPQQLQGVLRPDEHACIERLQVSADLVRLCALFATRRRILI
jgi:hypothetical protein